jgi:tetratricopeptide (TPR) repeat protein
MLKSPYNTELQGAKDALIQGDIERAAEIVDRAIKQNDADARALTIRSEILILKGNLAGARSAADRAVRIDPNLVEPRLKLLHVAMKEGKQKEAQKHASDLISMVGVGQAGLTLAAKFLTNAKRFNQACQAWLKIAEIHPKKAAPLLKAAECALRAKAHTDVIELSDRALAIEAESVTALQLKIKALARLQRAAQCADAIKLLSAIAPDAALPFVPQLIAMDQLRSAADVVVSTSDNNSNVAALRDNVAKAIRKKALALPNSDKQATNDLWQALLQIDSENETAKRRIHSLGQSYYQTGKALAAAGDLEGADRAFTDLISTQPQHERGLRNWAALCERRQDWKRASEIWTKLTTIVPQPKAELMRAARAAEKANDRNGALSLYEQLKKTSAPSPQVAARTKSLLRATMVSIREQIQQDDFAGASELIRKFRHHGDPMIERMAALWMAAVTKQFRNARSEHNTPEMKRLGSMVLSANENDLEVLRALSRAALLDKKYDEAVGYLERLVKLEPLDARSWFNLGRCLKAVHRYDAAIEACSHALALAPNDRAIAASLADAQARHSATTARRANKR